MLISLAPNFAVGSSNTFLNLTTASQPFWGNYASFAVTLLISFSCLLTCATAVANSPRILYQLAVNQDLSPVFAVVSPQGVLEPALVFTFFISCLGLAWGNLAQIVTVAGTVYLEQVREAEVLAVQPIGHKSLTVESGGIVAQCRAYSSLNNKNMATGNSFATFGTKYNCSIQFLPGRNRTAFFVDWF